MNGLTKNMWVEAGTYTPPKGPTLRLSRSGPVLAPNWQFPENVTGLFKPV
jgi:hypothetical protein